MRISSLSGSALSSCVAVALLAGCGGGSGTPLSPSPLGVSAERTHKLPAYRVLYSFRGGSDGAFPSAGLTNVNGTLYGTTTDGGGGCSGSLSCGSVYSISASGEETVLYSFKGGSADGAHPVASLLNVNGTLYGTTAGGGMYGEGTVFTITTSGKETVLYGFKGGPADGGHPYASLLNVNGTLYGTTAEGGSLSCSGNGTSGCGTVFSITTSGKETVLHRFKDRTTDGQSPYAGLINVNGKLYGTTNWGGANCENGLACGTVFSITRSGKETMRYSFKGGADGQNPQAALINVNGTLYGTVTG
ncbi:MAG: choice-of-anchor tandem repeat GloVer-containing protein, partial [Candidatus Cybelea sp.]